MKYIPKKTYIGDKIKLIAIALVVVVFVIGKSDPDIVVPAAFVAFLIFATLNYFILPSLWEKSIGEMMKNAPRKDLEQFSSELSRHLPVLARKRKFLVVKDDYGYTITDKWESEKLSFLKKFNYIPLATEYYNGINLEQQNMALDAFVREYLEDNNVQSEYSDEMRPSEYEYFCSQLLNDNGWTAKTTKAVGDQGVDVIAERPGLKVAIQCKKYSNPVGNKAVQEVTAGRSYWDADIAVVVTNSTYTPSARTLATSLGVFLLHHEQLPELLEIIEGVLEVEN